MDGNVHPVSPSELYGRLGTASAPSLVDVRRDEAFEEDDKLISGAYHRPPEDVSRWLSELPTDRERSALSGWTCIGSRLSIPGGHSGPALKSRGLLGVRQVRSAFSDARRPPGVELLSARRLT
jgi:hypothetical protein